MIRLKLIIVILLSCNLFAQNKLLKTDIENDKVFKNPYELEEYYFKLPNLKSSTYKIHFRFNFYSQVIDVYSNDSISFEGKILNQVYEMKSVKEKDQQFPSLAREKYIYEIADLDKDLATKIGSTILQTRLFKIPSDRDISGWNENWFDCGGVNFQFKISNEIIETAYVCPWHQDDSLEYVKVLKEFFEMTRKGLFEFNYNKKFEEKLERKKSYSNGLITFYKS